MPVLSDAEDLAPYLAPGRYVDSDHPVIVALARESTAGLSSPRAIAVALYYAVRDGFRYDPYAFSGTTAHLAASAVVEAGSGFCIPKAALLAATARAVGIPARLGFADVKNHLTSPRLMEMMGTDEFVYHGYTELWLDGRWIKATPAFNRSLCDKAGIQPLEFDGVSDSIFHPLDISGRTHMQYLRDHGSRADVPVEEILAAWRGAYPKMLDWGTLSGSGGIRFEQEAVRRL